MGIFDLLFGKKEQETYFKNAVTKTPSAPEIHYIHTNRNSERVIDKDFNILVLWWIMKKKKGYDRTTNKFPQWFEKNYGIDFNRIMDAYISEGLLSVKDNVVTITNDGEEKLKEFDYVVYVYEHAQYVLTLDDFRRAPNLHKIQNSDIAWGVFNSRILNYIQNRQWESLAANYGNMADLLINEKRYEDALEFIFAVAYIETSGMKDGNELTPINEEVKKNGWKKTYLSNGMPDICLLEINDFYVTEPFAEVQKNLNLDWDKIKERFLQSKQIQSLESILPFKYFEKEATFEIFKEAVQADEKKGFFPLKDVSKKLKVNIPDEHSRKYFYASVQNIVNRKFK